MIEIILKVICVLLIFFVLVFLVEQISSVINKKIEKAIEYKNKSMRKF